MEQNSQNWFYSFTIRVSNAYTTAAERFVLFVVLSVFTENYNLIITNLVPRSQINGASPKLIANTHFQSWISKDFLFKDVPLLVWSSCLALVHSLTGGGAKFLSWSIWKPAFWSPANCYPVRNPYGPGSGSGLSACQMNRAGSEPFSLVSRQHQGSPRHHCLVQVDLAERARSSKEGREFPVVSANRKPADVPQGHTPFT